MRSETLASLYSHIAVEKGDIIERPGGEPMIFDELDVDCRYVLLRPMDAHTFGRLHIGVSGAALAFLDAELLVKRPFSTDGVDHRAFRIVP